MIIKDINDRERECARVELDKAYPGYVRVDFEKATGRKYSEWYRVEDFVNRNPSLGKVVKDAPVMPVEIAGRVSDAGREWLSDEKMIWIENIYAGYHVWISRGKGEGQSRVVLKNDYKTIFVDKPWEEIPDKTSQYVLSKVEMRVKPMGNTLPETEVKKVRQRRVTKSIVGDGKRSWSKKKAGIWTLRGVV